MAIPIKPLTDFQIKNTKSKDKAYKLADGGGLYLYVTKLGAKSWRINYIKPITKKYATITLGLYPDITLA
ncbi:integrase arm-type DNA-binding domain-containing protein [Psychrobacter sp. 1176_08]|uniref:integrase arm-type DNA-binding domain-containing protein n=1 Tax=Psychrobacter sp. 1176_08 TaxID=2604452 RepID=UPI0040649D44